MLLIAAFFLNSGVSIAITFSLRLSSKSCLLPLMSFKYCSVFLLANAAYCLCPYFLSDKELIWVSVSFSPFCLASFKTCSRSLANGIYALSPSPSQAFSKAAPTDVQLSSSLFSPTVLNDFSLNVLIFTSSTSACVIILLLLYSL